MAKKFKRRDGFRGTKDYYFVAGSYPFTINPTEKDSQKRAIQKRPLPKKI